nr:calcium:calmodulin dependent protein kinase I [Hymenolepis microstoma]
MPMRREDHIDLKGSRFVYLHPRYPIR